MPHRKVSLAALALAAGIATASAAASPPGERASSATILAERARAAAAAGRPAEAVAQFNEAAALFAAVPDPRAQADAIARMGEAQEVLGRFDDALRSARTALAIHREIGDRVRQVSDLVDAGVAEEDLGRYAAALADQQKALAQARALGSRLDAADALGNIGIVEMRLGRYEPALRAHGESLAIDRSIGNRLGEGDELGRIGIVDEQLGRYDEALRELRAALAVHRAIGNRRGEAKTLNNIGIVDEHLGRYAEALRSHDEALPLFRAIGNRLGEADALGNIGIVDADLGRYAAALAAQESALAIFTALDNRLGQAEDLANTAIVDNDLGRYDESLQALDRALVLDRDIGNQLGEANALGSVGVVYEDLGRYEDALGEFQAALAIHRKIGNLRGQAGDLGNVGIVLGDLGRLSDAVDAESDAFELDRTLNDPAGEAADLNNVANLEERAGRYENARRDHERALALDRATGNRLGEADDLSNIGNEQNLLGHSAEGLAAARDALRIETGLGAPESLWRAQRVAARSEALLDRRDEAIADYDAAIARIETLRASLEAVAERRTFFENKLFVYDEFIDYLRDLDGRFPGRGYDRKALNVFEREQGRAFLEEIGQSSARSFSGVPPHVTAEEADLARAQERVESGLAKSRSAEPVDAEAVSSQERELADLRRRRAALEAGVRIAYPAYYALTHPQPGDPATLQQLLAPGEAVLVYAVLDRATALWVIDRSHFELLSLPGGTKDVAAKVDAVLRGPHALQSAIDNGESRTRVLTKLAVSDLPQVSSDAFALYRWLVPPAARPTVEAASQLLVVPTGPLYQLPWEALVTQDPTGAAEPHYLIDDHAVSYLSSSSLLAVLRAAEVQRRAPRYSIVAFANPDYGSDAAPDRGRESLAKVQSNVLASYIANEPQSSFPELLGTEVEAKAVLATLDPPPESHPLYEGEEASRENILALEAADCAKGPCLRDYRYVLFATHAVLPDEVEGLLQPALVLSHPERGGAFLTMGDVLGLSLDADVVSLSACNTGRGELTHGDGVRGLTQAFMYAGSPVVSVTLWELNDLAASKLTPAFYAGLKAGKSPSDALRDAKRGLLHGADELMRFPFYWAPTVIFGDGASRLAKP